MSRNCWDVLRDRGRGRERGGREGEREGGREKEREGGRGREGEGGVWVGD